MARCDRKVNATAAITRIASVMVSSHGASMTKDSVRKGLYHALELPPRRWSRETMLTRQRVLPRPVVCGIRYECYLLAASLTPISSKRPSTI